MFGAYTAVGFGSDPANKTGKWVKDEQAFLFRLVCGGAVDNPPIKCKSKAGHGTDYAVCGTDI